MAFDVPRNLITEPSMEAEGDWSGLAGSGHSMTLPYATVDAYDGANVCRDWHDGAGGGVGIVGQLLIPINASVRVYHSIRVRRKQAGGTVLLISIGKDNLYRFGCVLVGGTWVGAGGGPENGDNIEYCNPLKDANVEVDVSRIRTLTTDEWTQITWSSVGNVGMSPAEYVVECIPLAGKYSGVSEWFYDTAAVVVEMPSKRRDILDAVIATLQATVIPNVATIERGPVVQRDIEQYGHVSVYYDHELKQYAEMHRREGLLRIAIRVSYQGEDADAKCDDIVRDIETVLETKDGNNLFLGQNVIYDINMVEVRPDEEASQTHQQLRIWDSVFEVRYRYDRTDG